MIDVAESHFDVNQEFCVSETIENSPQSKVEDTSTESTDELKCPDSSKNRQGGTFQWIEYGFEKDQLEKKYCLAMSTISLESAIALRIEQEFALHDHDSCGEYGSTRLWFRQYDGNEMFDALASHLECM